MRDFDYSHYKNLIIVNEVLNLISHIYEYKGKQALLLQEKPEILNKLRTSAEIQSVKSSNRIEGILTTDNRIKDLVLEKTLPKTKDEDEISGYNSVLKSINQSFSYIPVNSETILQLHKELFNKTVKQFGGKFKEEPNAIIGTDSEGKKILIFQPLDPFQTPEAVYKICQSYNECNKNQTLDPLILIPLFINDFLCIHPFSDGNGRLSRLLSNLLLFKSGFYVGKYISLEKIIEETKIDYYNSLIFSGKGWKDNEENPLYFIKYFLKTVLKAYQELEEKLNLNSSKSTAKEKVKQVISENIGKITKREIAEIIPYLGKSTIEKALKDLVEEGFILKEGKGKNTFYYRNSD